MRTASQRVGQDEKQEILDLLENSAVSFTNAELDRSRLRKIRDNQVNFDLEIWRKIGALGWLDLLSTDENEINFIARAVKLIAYYMGTKGAPEPFMECGIGPLSLLNGSAKNLEFTDSLASCNTLAGHHISSSNEIEFYKKESVIDGEIIGLQIPAQADFVILGLLNSSESYILKIKLDDPDLTISETNLADGSNCLKIRFSKYKLKDEQIIASGKKAEANIQRSKNLNLIAHSAYLNGMSEELLKITIEYLKTRTQFGKKIGSFQALQHRAVDMYMQLRISGAVLEDALESLSEETDAFVIEKLLSRAKYRSNQTAKIITREAIQMHGGMGYTDECDVGLFVNKALVLTSRLGNCTEHSENFQKLEKLMPNNHEPDKCFSTSWKSKPEKGWSSLSDEEFRKISRSFLKSEYPESMRYPTKRFRWAEVKGWYVKQSKYGWVAPAWPEQYGGMGLTPSQQLIHIEELERHGVGRAPDMGIVMVGPLLIKHGTEAQRAQYLPDILSGKTIWCQGYSEPNAGSDLASLQTKAVKDGDEFVINGQKTWTTMAQDATHMFCLAKTSSNKKPQESISFFLINLNQPGVTVRPIKNIAGHEEFCEVFLDDVRVPFDSMIGGINKGWSIAKALLGFERIFLGSPRQSQYVLQRIEEIFTQNQAEISSSYQDRFTRLKLDVLDLESIYQKFADIVRKGEELGPDVSILKIWATETFAELTELLIDLAQSQGSKLGDVSFGNSKVDVLSQFYNARPATIYGGSNEIQRNIISKNVLSLPS
ncbi:MAG: hypothetical protein CBC29_08480 [Methylococcaceae bacterium TMED69]|nr:MAG: hypothetical protein CBC29_08480 [Methylococcaceae bacterium TMED69]